MTIVRRFHSPGNLKDFDSIPNQVEAWHEIISDFFNSNIQDVQQELATLGGIPQFYNPSVTETSSDMQTLDITWNAFPRVIQILNHNNPDLYLPAAEKLNPNGIRQHDEYCEWHTERDQENKVLRVTFTCEGPEYWQSLADGYPTRYSGPRTAGAQGSKDVLLAMYQKYISKDVSLTDLLNPDGTYNPNNKWNTTHGAMHLIQPNNTLFAEINIAARATILRKDAHGEMINEPTALINCSRFGEAQRFSDPTIGFQVNKLAQQGLMITLQNPVGLYISDLDTSGFEAPDGSDPAQYWTILRGQKGQVLRAVYEVPTSANFKVGDMTIDGRPIEFGGQIAESITMKLTGVASKHHSVQNPLLPCLGSSDDAVRPAGLVTGDDEILPTRVIR